MDRASWTVPGSSSIGDLTSFSVSAIMQRERRMISARASTGHGQDVHRRSWPNGLCARPTWRAGQDAGSVDVSLNGAAQTRNKNSAPPIDSRAPDKRGEVWRETRATYRTCTALCIPTFPRSIGERRASRTRGPLVSPCRPARSQTAAFFAPFRTGRPEIVRS